MVSYLVFFVHFLSHHVKFWDIFMRLHDAIGREALSENAKKRELVTFCFIDIYLNYPNNN